jgi:hypothetical protein
LIEEAGMPREQISAEEISLRLIGAKKEDVAELFDVELGPVEPGRESDDEYESWIAGVVDPTLRDEPPAVQNRDELDQLAFQRFCELLPKDAPSGEFDLYWRKMGDLAMIEGLIAPMTAGELEAVVIAKVSNIAHSAIFYIG